MVNVQCLNLKDREYTNLLSFNKYLLSSYYESGSALGSEDTAMSKIKNLLPMELTS